MLWRLREAGPSRSTFPLFFQMDPWAFELLHTTKLRTWVSHHHLLSVLHAQISRHQILHQEPSRGPFSKGTFSKVHSLAVGTNSAKPSCSLTLNVISILGTCFVCNKWILENIILCERNNFSCKNVIPNGKLADKISFWKHSEDLQNHTIQRAAHLALAWILCRGRGYAFTVS